MVDVGKLISLENLLVGKVTWFVLSTTSAPLILSSAFGANHMIRMAYIYPHLPRTHSLTFWLPETALSFSSFRLPETAWPCHFVKTQLNTRNMGAYTFYDLFLSCSAFSVWLVPVSKTASEISSNPERDKQPTWEKTRSSWNTLLYFCTLIPRIHTVTYTHAHTQRNI